MAPQKVLWKFYQVGKLLRTLLSALVDILWDWSWGFHLWQRKIFWSNLVNASHPNPGQRENYLKFLFSYFFVVRQKVLWRPLKAFIKPFEVPQRSVKILVNFYFWCNFLKRTRCEGLTLNDIRCIRIWAWQKWGKIRW